MYNAVAKAVFLYPKINPKGCIHAIQVDSDTNFFIKNSLFTISIHAVHAGCDPTYCDVIVNRYIISIHAAHKGSDCYGKIANGGSNKFQSTLPMRAASIFSSSTAVRLKISIHAAHEGCDDLSKMDKDKPVISIHAAHEGCDLPRCRTRWRLRYFNPRSP